MAIELLKPSGAAARDDNHDDSASTDVSSIDVSSTDTAQHDVPGDADAGLGEAGAPNPLAEGEAGLQETALVDSLLVHHYDFDGDGAVVVDVAGGADALLMGGAVLDGSGGVELDGVDDYVDLPNGLISRLPSLTVTVWLEWRGGACWQRIFDFGSSLDGEDRASRATSSLFITPASCPTSHVGPVQEFVLSAMFHVPGSVYIAQQEVALPRDVPTFVALTADSETGLRVYVDGSLTAELIAPLDISQLDDVNNWLGRSQWGQDAALAARLDDVRIYAASLSEAQVQGVFAATRHAR